jgi:hypothetical protein
MCSLICSRGSKLRAPKNAGTGFAEPVPASSKSGGIQFLLRIGAGGGGLLGGGGGGMGGYGGNGGLGYRGGGLSFGANGGNAGANNGSSGIATGATRQRCRRLERLRRWHSGDGEAGIGGTILVQSGSSVTLSRVARGRPQRGAWFGVADDRPTTGTSITFSGSGTGGLTNIGPGTNTYATPRPERSALPTTRRSGPAR